MRISKDRSQYWLSAEFSILCCWLPPSLLHSREGENMTYGMVGACHSVFRKISFSNYQTWLWNYIYYEFQLETTNFNTFLRNWPILRKICGKRGSCFESFRHKTHPHWQKIPLTVNLLCTQPIDCILDMYWMWYFVFNASPSFAKIRSDNRKSQLHTI